jgi:decaprenyl-phosphate phosphoribosyltransferase
MVSQATMSRGLVGGVVTAMRPRQWTKNFLVAAVPLAAGEIFERDVLVATIVTFIAFCLASSGTYLINDVLDVDADRAHPTKRFRPLAAGEIARSSALACAGALFVLSLLVASTTRRPLVFTVLAYIGATLLYSTWLKREPVIELAVLTLGFLLRALAGSAATGIPVSRWFLIVAGFGSLFMAAGKRYCELRAHDQSRQNTRASLMYYTPSYLRFVWGMSAAVAAMAYTLWAFDVGNGTATLPWSLWSIFPFVLAILRYASDIDSGHAESPEDVAVKDRVLLGVAICWLVLFTLSAFNV